MLSSVHCMGAISMNSQKLWLPAQEIQKMKLERLEKDSGAALRAYEELLVVDGC